MFLERVPTRQSCHAALPAVKCPDQLTAPPAVRSTPRTYVPPGRTTSRCGTIRRGASLVPALPALLALLPAPHPAPPQPSLCLSSCSAVRSCAPCRPTCSRALRTIATATRACSNRSLCMRVLRIWRPPRCWLSRNLPWSSRSRCRRWRGRRGRRRPGAARCTSALRGPAPAFLPCVLSPRYQPWGPLTAAPPRPLGAVILRERKPNRTRTACDVSHRHVEKCVIYLNQGSWSTAGSNSDESADTALISQSSSVHCPDLCIALSGFGAPVLLSHCVASETSVNVSTM